MFKKILLGVLSIFIRRSLTFDADITPQNHLCPPIHFHNFVMTFSAARGIGKSLCADALPRCVHARRPRYENQPDRSQGPGEPVID